MDKEKSILPQQIQVNDAMVSAGAEILTRWKYESDSISERQAAREIFEAMLKHLPEQTL